MIRLGEVPAGSCPDCGGNPATCGCSDTNDAAAGAANELGLEEDEDASS